MMVATTPLLFFAAVLGPAPLTVAPHAGAQPTWPDGSLLPEDYDWVRLPSDEWLKGDLKALYDDELEFDSDELGIVMLDWDDIKELRSAEILQVRATGGRIAIGRVMLESGELNILGADVAFPQESKSPSRTRTASCRNRTTGLCRGPGLGVLRPGLRQTRGATGRTDNTGGPAVTQGCR
jgi:hypothetical protein